MSQAEILQQQAEATAARYLKNVVIIDNEPEFSSSDKEGSLHFLDARKLTKGFSKKDITCSLLALHEEESATSDTIATAACEYANIVQAADVAVLDWQMSASAETASYLCRAIIKRVVEQDSLGLRPRLLVVYTGEKILEELCSILRTDLETIPSIELKEIPGVEFGIAINRLHIAFFSKSERKDALNPSVLTPDEIPDKIITLFSSHTKGILPSSVFNSIAILRETLPNLLSEYTENLDSAFVQHLIQIPDTDDGYSFLIELIKESITEPILCDSEMHKFMHEQYLQGWKSSAQEQRFPKLDKDKFSQLLGFTPTGNGLSNSQLEKLRTSIDCTCNDDELNSFARLSIIKRDSASPILATSANAHLGYGTVIKCDGQYYLCLLPKCDSVRLKKIFVQVPLLKLDGGTTAQKKPHLVLKDTEYKRLRYPSTKFWNEIDVVSFKVDSSTSRISPKNKNGKLLFSEYIESAVTEPPIQAREFEWVADLKDSAMLSIHQKIFANVSRIGSDEFEWVRRNQVVGNDCENCSAIPVVAAGDGKVK